LTVSKPSYQSMAIAIANHVWEHWYKEEPKIDENGREIWVKTVDDCWNSGMQIPVGTLKRLKVLEALHEKSSRSEFTCEPKDFEEVINKNKELGCSYDMLVLALICLLDFGIPKPIFELLVELEVCEAALTPPVRVNWSIDLNATSFDPIRWTTRRDLYFGLYENWPSNLLSTKYDDPQI